MKGGRRVQPWHVIVNDTGSDRVRFVCLQVIENLQAQGHVLLLGTTTGKIHVYKDKGGENYQFDKIISPVGLDDQKKAEGIVKIEYHQVEDVCAVATKGGHIYVLRAGLCRALCGEVILQLTQHVNKQVTQLAWLRCSFGLVLCTGDETGQLLISKVSTAVNQRLSKFETSLQQMLKVIDGTLQESVSSGILYYWQLEYPIVQLCMHTENTLIVSTTIASSVLNVMEGKLIQIGKKARKGYFGCCSHGNLPSTPLFESLKSSDNLILAARPGKRLWIASQNQVKGTLKLNVIPHELPCNLAWMVDAIPDGQGLQLGQLYPFGPNVISHCNSLISIIDMEKCCIRQTWASKTQDELIFSASVSGNKLFVLSPTNSQVALLKFINYDDLKEEQVGACSNVNVNSDNVPNAKNSPPHTSKINEGIGLTEEKAPLVKVRSSERVENGKHLNGERLKDPVNDNVFENEEDFEKRSANDFHLMECSTSSDKVESATSKSADPDLKMIHKDDVREGVLALNDVVKGMPHVIAPSLSKTRSLDINMQRQQDKQSHQRNKSFGGVERRRKQSKVAEISVSKRAPKSSKIAKSKTTRAEIKEEEIENREDIDKLISSTLSMAIDMKAVTENVSSRTEPEHPRIGHSVSPLEKSASTGKNPMTTDVANVVDFEIEEYCETIKLSPWYTYIKVENGVKEIQDIVNKWLEGIDKKELCDNSMYSMAARFALCMAYRTLDASKLVLPLMQWLVSVKARGYEWESTLRDKNELALLRASRQLELEDLLKGKGEPSVEVNGSDMIPMETEQIIAILSKDLDYEVCESRIKGILLRRPSDLWSSILAKTLDDYMSSILSAKNDLQCDFALVLCRICEIAWNLIGHDFAFELVNQVLAYEKDASLHHQVCIAIRDASHTLVELQKKDFYRDKAAQDVLRPINSYFSQPLHLALGKRSRMRSALEREIHGQSALNFGGKEPSCDSNRLGAYNDKVDEQAGHWGFRLDINGKICKICGRSVHGMDCDNPLVLFPDGGIYHRKCCPEDAPQSKMPGTLTSHVQ